jgi:hypothetical protein
LAASPIYIAMNECVKEVFGFFFVSSWLGCLKKMIDVDDFFMGVGGINQC